MSSSLDPTPFCTAHPADASCQQSCQINSSTILHGAGQLFYFAAQGACLSETRTCSNGSLSGTATHDTCTIAKQATDLNADGRADVCVRQASGVHCWFSNGTSWTPTITNTALSDVNGWDDSQYFQTVHYVDINGDKKADLCARAVTGLECWTLETNSWEAAAGITSLSDANGWDKPEYYQTLQFGDIDGDEREDLCARGANGLVCWLSTPGGWVSTGGIASLSDANNWNRPEYFQTLHFTDINGDRKKDFCARGPSGLACWQLLAGTWTPDIGIAALSDSNGWNKASRYGTMTFADMNADGKEDLCARASDGIKCWLADASGWLTTYDIPSLSDANGWNAPQYAQTIQRPDLNGDNRSDLCARRSDGLVCWLSTTSGWVSYSALPVFSDVLGWDKPEYYQTIRFADLDGDFRSDVCARGSSGLRCWYGSQSGWSAATGLTDLSDAGGANQKSIYQTLGFSSRAKQPLELLSPMPTVALTFDVHSTTATLAYPILKARLITGTYFNDPVDIDNGQATTAQLQAMQSDGWSIQGYSGTNMVTLLTNLGAQAATDKMNEIKTDMASKGFNITTLAPAQRAWNTTLRNLASGIFTHVRAVGGPVGEWQVQPVSDLLYVDNGVTTSLSDNNDTIASLSAQLLSLQKSGGIWIPVVHKVGDDADPAYSINTAAFTAFGDLIRAEVLAGRLRTVNFEEINPTLYVPASQLPW